MAKISFGALISEARNKVGDVVFTRNHSGPVVRMWVKPIQPTSTTRAAVQAAMRALMLAWSATLTQTQRDGWNTLAKRQPPKPAPVYSKKNPGLNWYIQLNLALQLYFTRHDDAPTVLLAQETGGFTGLTLNSDTATFMIDAVHRPDANHALMVYASEVKNVGRTSSRLFYTAVAQLKSTHTFPASIWEKYQERFPTLAPLKRVFLKIHMLNLNTGATSQDYFDHVDDAATQGDQMLQKTVLLTNAQIQALPTTPVQIIPAPGAAKFIIFHRAVIQKNTAAAAYTNISAAALNPFVTFRFPSNHTPAAFAIDSSNILPNQTQLSALLAADNGMVDFDIQQNTTSAPAQGIITSINVNDADTDQPLRIDASNPAGNFTGGNAANYWVVSVFYSIINIQ